MDNSGTRTSLAGLGSLTGIAQATVAGGNDVAVKVGDTIVTARTLRHAGVTAGDAVLITRQGAHWWVVGMVGTVAPPAAPEPLYGQTAPDPKPSVRTGKLIVSPVETRTYRNGKWRTDDDATDTYQGQSSTTAGNNFGCAFYGAKPRSLAGAVVVSATVKAKRVEAVGGNLGVPLQTTLRRVLESTRPAGSPTSVAGEAPGPALKVNETADFPIPTAWAQSLVDGTAGGLAVFTSTLEPYVKLAGRNRWSAAWTLTINWQRTV